MPECIFCEEDGPDLSSDCEICPDCGVPPFSGMMFNPEQKEEAARLEKEDDFGGAFSILSEEWKSHTDVDYFDEKMAETIESWIENLFERHPEMSAQRVEFCLDKMTLLHFYGAHNEAIDFAEKAIRIAKDVNRFDLELEVIDAHLSIQRRRYGGAEHIPDYVLLKERRQEIEDLIQQNGEL
jgi:hypothetical protein